MNLQFANKVYHISEKDLDFFPRELCKFESEKSDQDCSIQFEVVPKIENKEINSLNSVIRTTVFNKDESTCKCYFRIAEGADKFDARTIISSDSIKIEITPTMKNTLINNKRWGLTLLCLDVILAFSHCIILHSSLINFRGSSLIFSAPSGVGKSTQADLWQQYQGAQIINGDRSGLFFNDGKLYSCGLPISGSSNICMNKTSPVKAIVILKQSKLNRLIRLNPLGAFKELWPETSFDRTDDNTAEMAMSFLGELICSVPIYKLENCADQNSVQILYDELF